MKKIVVTCILVAGVVFFVTKSPTHILENVKNFLAATFFVQSITTEDLKLKYDRSLVTGEKVKILIIPGHEPDFGGTEFGDLKERDMNLVLSEELSEYFKRNPRYEVMVTRDSNGWNPELKKYFDTNWETIRSFTKSKKLEMKRLIENGQVVRVEDVYHNNALSDVATRLYGINKWSVEKEVDILIHVHFNDYPRARTDLPGIYRGFAIYVPEKQYSNSLATREIAQNLFSELKKSFAVSNLPIEDIGIVESQDLIAVGSGNTVDGVSVLIEYGYIYRRQFTNVFLRDDALSEMARLTYRGVQNFFE